MEKEEGKSVLDVEVEVVCNITRLHLAAHTHTHIKLYLYRFKGRYQIRLYGENASKGKKPFPFDSSDWSRQKNKQLPTKTPPYVKRACGLL